MTSEEVSEKMGGETTWDMASPDIRATFTKIFVELGIQYGESQTRNAWHWWLNGYLAADWVKEAEVTKH